MRNYCEKAIHAEIDILKWARLLKDSCYWIADSSGNVCQLQSCKGENSDCRSITNIFLATELIPFSASWQVLSDRSFGIPVHYAMTNAQINGERGCRELHDFPTPSDPHQPSVDQKPPSLGPCGFWSPMVAWLGIMRFGMGMGSCFYQWSMGMGVTGCCQLPISPLVWTLFMG